MSTIVTFYNNPYQLPHYIRTLSGGSTKEYKPVNIGNPSGSIMSEITKTELDTFNYIEFQGTFAWITGYINKGNDNYFEISYEVDPIRTYWGNIVFGNQFIVRSPSPTGKYDKLLETDEPYDVIESEPGIFEDPFIRYLIVQVRGIADQSTFLSNTPFQPTPYLYYVTSYNQLVWTSSQPIADLINTFSNNPEITNLVTIYSLPWVDTSSTIVADMELELPDGSIETVSGFNAYTINSVAINTRVTPITINLPNNVTRTDHNVDVMIPEAGIINIPEEVLHKGIPLAIREDVDFYSGAVNYWIVNENDIVETFGQSIRGGSVSSVPVISNPLDTYLSQNQNTQIVSLLGDVANIGGGAVALKAGQIGLGAGLIGNGIGGLAGKVDNRSRARNSASNPPSFLGTALTPNTGHAYWIIYSYKDYTNASEVHTDKGYLQNMYKALNPTTGYYETSNCMVRGNNVPQWAINSFNSVFNAGIRIY